MGDDTWTGCVLYTFLQCSAEDAPYVRKTDLRDNLSCDRFLCHHPLITQLSLIYIRSDLVFIRSFISSRTKNTLDLGQIVSESTYFGNKNTLFIVLIIQGRWIVLPYCLPSTTYSRTKKNFEFGSNCHTNRSDQFVPVVVPFVSKQNIVYSLFIIYDEHCLYLVFLSSKYILISKQKYF